MFSDSKVRTCLWFDRSGEDAARFYVSLLPDSAIESVFRPDAAKPPLVVTFHLAGVPYMILNGGPHHKLSPAASICVQTDDQAETDRLWDALVEGGKPVACGWLEDRFGVSWQITPKRLLELMMDKDEARAGRVMQAMMQMVKIDIAALENAAGALSARTDTSER